MRHRSISTRSWAGFIAVTLTSASFGQAYVMSQGQASKLPTLGWNSWNAYHCDINAEQFLEAAQAIVDRGLRDAGYNYVNIDDCWQVKNGRIDGHIAVNRDKFPDGIDGLAEKIHALKLKIGIYSTAGTTTCAGYPASLEHEDIDAADWASWGIDYLKYDNCNIPSSWQDQYVACDPASTHLGANGTCNSKDEPRLASAGYDWHRSKSYERFKRMRDALAKQKREIVYNMCIWGTADVFSWGKDLAASWRMSEDIRSNWNSIKSIINQNSFKMHSTNFYGHGDADMLEVGNGLSPAETRTHFALWAAMKSPLLIGSNVKNLTQDDVNVLKNSYLLAFNQDDQYGEPAQPYKWGVNPQWTYDAANPAEFWAGASKIGHLVLMMNVRNDKTTKTAIWNEVPGLQSEKYHVTDVWTGKDLGCLSSYSVAVDAHDTAAILVPAGNGTIKNYQIQGESSAKIIAKLEAKCAEQTAQLSKVYSNAVSSWAQDVSRDMPDDVVKSTISSFFQGDFFSWCADMCAPEIDWSKSHEKILDRYNLINQDYHYRSGPAHLRFDHTTADGCSSMVLLQAALAKSLVDIFLRNPYFLLDNGTILQNIESAFAKKSLKESISWRVNTVRSLEKTYPLSNEHVEIHLNRFLNTFGFLIQDLDKPARDDLADLFTRFSQIALKLWQTPTLIRIGDMANMKNSPFDMSHSDIECEPAVASALGERLNGRPIGVVIRPCILSQSISDSGEKIPPVVWSKALVWVSGERDPYDME